MKKTIKLTESKIREMIAESVRKAINESENDAWAEYDTEKFFDDFSPTSKRAYLKSREYPNKLPNEEFNGWADDLKDELDKSWKKTKDIEKYEKMADLRPLHRKGSLNRVGMDENVIRKLVSETIRETIKEEIDTGQVPSASEKHSTSPSVPEIRKKIRALRNKISDYEEEGKDISELQKQIVKLKKEAGFCESTNRLQTIVSESVKSVLKEGFMDDLKTNVAYVKNKVKDNLPPLGPNTTDSVIDDCKQHIKWMEEHLQNKQKCGSKFLFHYRVSMEAAKEYGYVKYYKKMKELYDQMVEEGLYYNEYDINGPSFKEIYNDLDNRVKSRGGHFHG